MSIIAAVAGSAVAEVAVLPRPPMPPIEPPIRPPLPPPGITVIDLRADEKPVAVESAQEVVEDNGLVRRVRTRFTFTNPNNRVMQGEFEFPIPEGATVCGYSLDIEGQMVPGVICEKEKARAAFENEVRKGVDPGLVEHVKGNIWKTRIFPLNPNTPRRAEVDYVEPCLVPRASCIVAERDGEDVFIGEAQDTKQNAQCSVNDAVASFSSGVILWDASGSAAAHAAKWREKLNALPAEGQWRLVAFRNVPEDMGTFAKTDLLAAVDSLVYDGGTDISKAVAFVRSEPTLLFTDELDTLSLDVVRYDDMANITVASRPPAPERTVKIRRLAKGEAVPDGVEVKDGKLLATQWAAERINDLSSQADARREEFVELGRRYGVASPVTSLIVLERLDQYLEHDIEPPASLSFHDEWIKRTNAKDREIDFAEADAQHKTDLLSLWKERVEWWNKPIPPKKTPSSGLFDHVANGALGLARGRASSEMAVDAAAPMAARAMAANLSVAMDDDGADTAVEDVAMGEMMEAGFVGAELRGSLSLAAAAGEDVVELSEAPEPPPSSTQAGGGGATISITAWKADADYLKAIEKAADPYAEYLAQKKQLGTAPAFYMDCAGFFFRAGKNDIAERVLSSMAEFRLEDAAVWRSMGWRLREAGCYDAAIRCFEHALRLRGEEGQSRRDLALVLTEKGKAEKDATTLARAMELLHATAFTNWARRSGRRTNDRQVSIIALEELNALIAWCKAVKLDVKTPELEAVFRRDMPVKIRIVLSWDADETDIDLHVLEPDGEEAFYGHRRTSSGGFVSEDVTTGYGPEEYLRKEGGGKFKILTNYFASHQTALTGPATVTATVYTDWATAAEKREIITLRLDKPKSKVLIGEISVAE